MNIEEFRKTAHEFVDWIYEYYKTIDKRDVLPQISPGDIYAKINKEIPPDGESIDTIFKDFNTDIMPGITHWQHPGFYAYFPSNTSYPSILAEFLTAALGAQCMSWITSPAATELEQFVMEWFRDNIGLPKSFFGVIQDTASSSTLCSILTARESKSNFNTNTVGLKANDIEYTCYFSDQAHSSIEKAIKISGIGKNNIRLIKTNSHFEMIPEELEKQINIDIENGYAPLHLTVAIGTTGSVAIDPLQELAKIAKKYDIWIHVDAAYAGSALICDEYKKFIKGIELVDSFVFNAHKWLLTNFDCSLYFVKSKEKLIRTFEILPEYLKTNEKIEVNNYRDWGIQLGRRFRALKLWFVIRSYGLNGLRSHILKHIDITTKILSIIKRDIRFEICAPVHLNVICFRYNNFQTNNEKNKFNERLLKKINETGKYFFSHTKLNDVFVIRFSIGQTLAELDNVISAWNQIVKITEELERV